MAKENTLWFKHDYNSRRDPKLVRLRRVMKSTGIGIYWQLVEILHEQGNKIKMDEFIDICDELRESEVDVMRVIKEFELFTIESDVISNYRVSSSLKNKAMKSKAATDSVRNRWSKSPEIKKAKTIQNEINRLTDEIPKMANFFYVGTEMYKSAISQFIKLEFSMFLESWEMKNKEIKLESVLTEMDKECVGKTFSGLDHIMNTFKKTAKELNKPKFYKDNNTKPAVASGNYATKK